jgi:hypothetical protein
MKLVRRLSIALVTCGAVLLVLLLDAPLVTVPMPGPGLRATAFGNLPATGDYFIRMWVPSVGTKVGLPNNQSTACAVTITLSSPGAAPIKTTLQSFTLDEEIGAAHLLGYRTDNVWHLKRGWYSLDVDGLADCSIRAQGAAMELERELTRPTERYLTYLLAHAVGIALLAAGVLGLVVSEMKRT